MIQETMSVYKALCELKTLDSRILKEVDASNLVGCKKHAANKVNGIDTDTFKEEAKSAYDSITALIKRRNAIKRAVILSNATTKITVCGAEVSVAEAIDIKTNGYNYTDYLMNHMESQYRTANRTVTQENETKLENKTEAYIQTVFGKEGTSISVDSINKARATFREENTFEMIDPIHYADVMKAYKAKRDAFMTDVDSAISVSNATTMISIEY